MRKKTNICRGTRTLVAFIHASGRMCANARGWDSVSALEQAEGAALIVLIDPTSLSSCRLFQSNTIWWVTRGRIG